MTEVLARSWPAGYHWATPRNAGKAVANASTVNLGNSMRKRHSMNGHRISRIVASLGLATSLTLSLVALPGIALAALPDVLVGQGGTALTYAPNGATPSTVGPSEPVLIQTWAYNNDTSTVSQFYAAITSDGSLTGATWTMSTGESGICEPAGSYTCAFGQLKPGVSVVVSAVFTSPSSAGAMTTAFEFSTTGLGSGGNDNSHGDTWPVVNIVSVDSSGDFAGRYVNSSGLTTVQNNQTLGTGNVQSTIVYAPETGIGVTVDDSASCAAPSSCFGKASEISVANGKSYTTGFKVVINVHSSEIPSGINANNITVWHDGVEITDSCGRTPAPDCFSAKKFKWGIQITIWLTHNGKITFA